MTQAHKDILKNLESSDQTAPEVNTQTMKKVCHLRINKAQQAKLINAKNSMTTDASFLKENPPPYCTINQVCDIFRLNASQRKFFTRIASFVLDMICHRCATFLDKSIQEKFPKPDQFRMLISGEGGQEKVKLSKPSCF